MLLPHTWDGTLLLVSTQLLFVPTTATADLPSALLSLDSTPQTDVFVPNELPDDIHPAFVRWQVIVKLVRDLVQFVQTRPRHGRKVVVLIVQADVVGEEVEHAVVRVRLRDRNLVGLVQCLLVWLLEDVMLCDEMACTRVQRSCQEATQNHVSKGFSTDGLYEGVVEDELCDDVEEVDLGQRELVDEHGTKGVEEDLESAEEGFASNRVEEDGFEGSGQIRVKAVDAERLVMGEMVGSKGCAVRYANGEVGEDSKQPVCQRAPESQVVRDLVDGKEEVLVCGGTN